MTVSEYLAEIDAVNRGGVYQPEWESLCTHPVPTAQKTPPKPRLWRITGPIASHP